MVAFTGLRGFFHWGVVYHPVTRSCACGLFILRRCMVRQLQCLLSLDSRPLYQVDYLRARHVCCASDSLRIPGTLSWRILDVLCSPFRWIPLPRGFVVEGLFFSYPSGRLHHWRDWRPPSIRFASSMTSIGPSTGGTPGQSNTPALGRNLRRGYDGGARGRRGR